MASSDWPALPDEGFSYELKSIVDDTNEGTSWEQSENIFGSPGLPNYDFYDFQKPSGKDSSFNSYETHILGFNSSHDFYSDPDYHNMAGISIIEISGPGHLYLGDTLLEQGQTYGPSDLIFKPQEPFTNSSILRYSFIDASGQEGSEHIISFLPAVHAAQRARENFRLYPVPARDFCFIEIPSQHRGAIEFSLVDLNGKILQLHHFKNTGSLLKIDLTTVDSGMYFYLLKTDQSLVNGKIQVIK
jgi:hypothetical protein